MSVQNIISSFIIGTPFVIGAITLLMNAGVIHAAFADVPALAVAQPRVAMGIVFFTFALGAGVHCIFSYFTKR